MDAFKEKMFQLADQLAWVQLSLQRRGQPILHNTTYHLDYCHLGKSELRELDTGMSKL